MAKAATKSKITHSKQDIISFYMNYCLEHEKTPRSVFKFCKALEIEESAFYAHFASLEALSASVWLAFHENTIETLAKDKQYENYDRRAQLLSYYFAFFELLTLNRSYVLFSLKETSGVESLKKLAVLSELRKRFLAFIKPFITAGNEEKKYSFTKFNEGIFSEVAWAQFLFLLKFYLEDRSPAFEKTDIAIEKSVNTVFDLFDNTPLENVLDFGKFLAKEVFSK